MLFFRQLQHLLPRARAWRTTVDKSLRRFFLGLAQLPEDARQFVDDVHLDLYPDTTRELAAWEEQFGLTSAGDDATRRQRLTATWLEEGGQDPDYIQSQLHAAGFTGVYIHEWWASGPPYVARDPRDYTTPPLLGAYQCESSDPWESFEPGPADPLAPYCDETLANDPGYLVNLDLTLRAPPPVPSDPTKWPYFLYFAGETFPDFGEVEASRLDEFRALVLRLCPTEQWIVTRVVAT